MATLSSEDLTDRLMRALTGVGFTAEHARALTAQTVLAEELGQPSVGVAHVFDYTSGVRDGRIDPTAEPIISRPAPTMIAVDGQQGLPQTGFARVFDDIVETAHQQGIALFLSRNGSLCGSLGTFTLRLAERGLMALATTNGSPLLAASGANQPIFCTNPLSFAAPVSLGAPLLIDQSCSATAYVNVRAAAERGETIPEGWAVDKDGKPTTDPEAAMDGALLPFGGARGANLALMVEVLSAGLTGANWSVDAGSFSDGSDCPATGLTVIAINAQAAAPGSAQRIASYLGRLAEEFGVHVPGQAKADKRRAAAAHGISVDNEQIAQLEALAGRSG